MRFLFVALRSLLPLPILRLWSFLRRGRSYAAYAGGLIGFSTFGPQFVMGLGYFDDEFTASIVFGGCMATAGLLGTPLGARAGCTRGALVHLGLCGGPRNQQLHPHALVYLIYRGGALAPLGGLAIDAALRRRRAAAGLRGAAVVGEEDARGVPVSFVNAAVLSLQFNGCGVALCTAICFQQTKVQLRRGGGFRATPGVGLSFLARTHALTPRTRIPFSFSFSWSSGGLFRGLYARGAVLVCVHCNDEPRRPRVGPAAPPPVRHRLLHPPHAPLW